MRVKRVPTPAVITKEYILSRVEINENGCWLWQGSVTHYGYGSVSIGGQRRGAHQLAYELWIGPIPKGLVPDHTCHNTDPDCPGGNACLHRRCANPEHLEAVTRRENVLRGRGPVADRARQTHCKRGHSLDDAYTSTGHRICRPCCLARVKANHQRRKEESAA